MIPAEKTTEEMDQTRWIAHIDDAVAEVFATMLHHPCAQAGQPSISAPASAPGISAKIAFSGALEGHCTVRISAAAADRLTDALLGAEGDWDDQMIDDAVGELCNMIAGGWKSRLTHPGAASQISIPTVTRTAASDTPATTRRFYEFNNETLEVALTLK